MKKLNSFVPYITVLMLILATFTMSCDKRNPPVVIPPLPEPPPASAERYITKMDATNYTIYADNSYTYSEVSVMVKDGNQFGVAGQTVDFKTTLGRIITTASTDSSGVATTTFWDNGEVGVAEITALVRNYSTEVADSILSEATATISINVIPVPEVGSISFFEMETHNGVKVLPLLVMQNITVRTRVLDELGNDVPDNTLITFNVTKGDFLTSGGEIVGDRIIAKTVNGRASVYYTAGASSGSGQITAAVFRDGAPIAMDQANIVISPGRPANIQLKAYVVSNGDETETYTSPVNSTNIILMKAIIRDAYSNICPSTPAKFTTDLGSFYNSAQTTTEQTNASGVAQVQFTPGLQAGAATITATANNDTLSTQIIFRVQSDNIHAINFTQAGQIDLNVANTGGTSSAVLRVQLKDINGNLIDTSKPVNFRIISTETDANLNNQPTNSTVTVLSTGGEAQVSVNSGFLSGPVTIRATCIVDSIVVTATKSNIVVHAGPPSIIQPYISGYASGTNIGGGLWRVIAGAMVRDVYNNPVDYGTSVFFSLILPSNIDPYNVQIRANAYTGNASALGDSTAGVAYTTLIYHGIYTFDQIQIVASAGSFDSNGDYLLQTNMATVTLPLNEPQLEAQAVPWHLDFFENAPPVGLYLEAEIWVTLTDSQGNLIHGATFLLSADRGTFVYSVPWDPAYPNHNGYFTQDFHLIQSGMEGKAKGRIRCHRYEVPPPDEMTGLPGSQSYQILVTLQGTGMLTDTNVTVRRYADNQG